MKGISNFVRNNFKYTAYVGGFIIFVYLLFVLINFYIPTFENSLFFRLFDVGHEMNVPTFFSSFMFVLLSGTSFSIAKKYVGKNKAWKILGYVFIFLALDELFQIHENATYFTQLFLNVRGFLAFAWVIPYGIIVILLSFYLVPFIFKLSKEIRNILFLGAFIYVLGVLGFEMLGSYFYEIGGPIHRGFIVSSSLEEIFEIIGLIVALYGFRMGLLK